ncbi:MAG: protocatechuate 3,4-dioxygenase [Gammaproteobacteria bacterium]
MTRKKMNRREALQLGMGAAGMAIAATTPGLAAGADVLTTPHQTEGPFFPNRDQPDKDIDLTKIKGHSARAKGKVILVRGIILDEDRKPVSGALIDVWQANVHGRYDHEDDTNPAPLDPNFQSWAKMVTGDDGAYEFKTIMPGAYKVDGVWSRPPHIHFKIARRGYHELTTQMYFAGEKLNDTDQILQALPKDEQALLVVNFESDTEGATAPTGQFDVLIRKV